MTIGSDNIFRKWDLESGKVLDEFLIPYSNYRSFDFNDSGNIMTTVLNFDRSGYHDFWDSVIIFNKDSIICHLRASWNYDFKHNTYTTYSLPDCKIAIDAKRNSLFTGLTVYVIEGDFGYYDHNDYFRGIYDTTLFKKIDSYGASILKYSPDYSFLAIFSIKYEWSTAYQEEYQRYYSALQIYSYDKGSNISFYNGGELDFNNLNFSYDSKLFLAESENNFTSVWNTDDGKMQYQSLYSPNSNTFSQDNRFLITAYNDNNIGKLFFYRQDNGLFIDSMLLDTTSQIGIMLPTPDSSGIVMAGNDGYLRYLNQMY